MTEARRQSGAEIAFDWWRRLNPLDGAQSGPHKAALARIRRAATPMEVLLVPEALKLVARLRFSPEKAAVVAGVLAFVRETEGRSVASAIGRSSLDDEQSAAMSEGRFRRLLQSSDGELMEAMRRLVRLRKGCANVTNLSKSILNWNDRTKQRWIFDYYGVAIGARSRTRATPASASTQSQP